MIIHNGREIPRFPDVWDVLDGQWLRAIWDDESQGLPIVSSTWTVPAGWTVVEEDFNIVIVNASGAKFFQGTQVKLNPSSVEGVYRLSNFVEFGSIGSGLTRNRSVDIEVAPL